jgi:hypothetical protein
MHLHIVNRVLRFIVAPAMGPANQNEGAGQTMGGRNWQAQFAEHQHCGGRAKFNDEAAEKQSRVMMQILAFVTLRLT